MELNLNGKTIKVDAPEDTPLLWVLRDELNMTGTKYGCGITMCGACTVHMDGEAVRSCVMPVSAFVGKKITTIEGTEGKVAQAVQKAWVDNHVPQCGYCQSGQVMSAVALLSKNKKPNDQEIDAAMDGNICRCGTYQRIRTAIHQASKELSGKMS